MVPVLFSLILIGCCGYGIACGGKPERTVAYMLLIAAGATALVGYGLPQPRGALRWPVMLVDFALAAGLMWVALKADRLWPLLVTALQLITAVAHPALEMSGRTAPRAYMIAIFMSGFLIPPVLACGTFLHQRRNSLTKS